MNKILISVPSFCDPELTSTVENLFKQASHPDSLMVVICHQNEEPELEKIQQYFLKHQRVHQIRLINFHFSQAKGPCFARYHVQQLCKELNESSIYDYFLSIDSHMRFVDQWDQKLVQEFKMCDNKKAIISCYPGEYNVLMGIDIIKHQTQPNFLRPDKFGSDGMLRLVGTKLEKKLENPQVCQFVAAGFYFGPISIINECPYPNDYDFLFFGEEMLMSCLLFNKGYSFFCPTRNLCYHQWDRSQRPKTFFQIQNNELKLRSQQKLINYLKSQTEFIESLIDILPQENNQLLSK